MDDKSPEQKEFSEADDKLLHQVALGSIRNEFSRRDRAPGILPNVLETDPEFIRAVEEKYELLCVYARRRMDRGLPAIPDPSEW